MNTLDKEFFKSKNVLGICRIIYSNRCFMCNKKFSDVLFNHRWNGEYLFHLSSSHGFPPELLIDILKDKYASS